MALSHILQAIKENMHTNRISTVFTFDDVIASKYINGNFSEFSKANIINMTSSSGIFVGFDRNHCLTNAMCTA